MHTYSIQPVVDSCISAGNQRVVIFPWRCNEAMMYPYVFNNGYQSNYVADILVLQPYMYCQAQALPCSDALHP